MYKTSTEPQNSKWFVRLDREDKPTSLTLYNFIGAEFEAHCIPLLDSPEKMFFWIEKIYAHDHIREVFEQIIFDADYPDELFTGFLAELCRVRNIKQKK
ncbi:MAG: hypothetical protein ACKOW2_04320 [Sphingobacteriaceae bacterium]